MTVHMFRCFVGKGPMDIGDLEARIDDWVDSNAAWVDDHDDHELGERETDGGDIYHAIDVRFLTQDAKSNLIQKFTDKLENKVDWYRVGYHLCEHSETSPGPCSWQDQVEWTDTDVTIPGGVPDFEVA